MEQAFLKNGGSAQRVMGAALSNIGYEKKSFAAGTVGQLTPSDTAAHEALVQAEGDVRWRADGVDPTTELGMVLIDGQSIILTGQDAITSFRFIGKSGAAAVNATYWG